MSKYATKLPNPWGEPTWLKGTDKPIDLSEFRLVAFPIKQRYAAGKGTTKIKAKKKGKRK